MAHADIIVKVETSPELLAEVHALREALAAISARAAEALADLRTREGLLHRAAALLDGLVLR